jgi:sugar (pentulose or hexulose) kinase
VAGIARTPVVCGVDIGTTNAKVVALDAAGTVVARVSRPTPRDANGLWIDAQALFETIEEMVIEACGTRYEVHAICAAGVGEDGVLVDSSLRPLTKALAWFDPRRQSIFRTLRPNLRDDASFDSESDPGRALVGWKWSRNQAALVDVDTASWIALADLPGVMFTGSPFISDTLASRTGAWRSTDRAWAHDRVELTLGSEHLLPKVVPTGDAVGTVDSARLRAAGVIASDAIAVAGGHDHPIGGWGVNQLIPGAVLDSMGTAEVIVMQSPLTGIARQNNVDVAPGIRSAGTTLLRVEELSRNVEWASQAPEVAARIRDLLGGTVAPEDVLDSHYFNPGTRGGGRPSYALDAPHDPLARASAVLGALAYAGRDAIEAVSAMVDTATAASTATAAGTPEAPSSGVLLAGGWVRSPGWVAIKATVNGYATAAVLEPEVTAVGAALLAAKARGWAVDPALALGELSS